MFFNVNCFYPVLQVNINNLKIPVSRKEYHSVNSPLMPVFLISVSGKKFAKTADFAHLNHHPHIQAAFLPLSQIDEGFSDESQ